MMVIPRNLLPSMALCILVVVLTGSTLVTVVMLVYFALAAAWLLNDRIAAEKLKRAPASERFESITVRYREDREWGGVSVVCHDEPSLITHAATLDEARALVRNALGREPWMVFVGNTCRAQDGTQSRMSDFEMYEAAKR